MFCESVLFLIGCNFVSVFEKLTSRKKKENPLWADILEHSWLKVVQWSKRMLSKWNFKIAEVVKAGRQPQIRSQSVCSVYRDAGREKEVRRMSCLMVHFDDFFKAHLTGAQYETLLVQWSTGRLDSRLTPEVIAMRPDFKPQDLAFLFVEVPEDPVNFLEDGTAKEKTAALEKLVKKVKSEQAAFRREQAMRKAAEGNYMSLHAAWSDKVEEELERLWEEHKINYQAFLVGDLAAGHRALVGARADLVGLDVPLSKPEQVPSICFWNVPMLGSSASTMIDQAVSVIAADCAHAPQLTLHLVCPQTKQPTARCMSRMLKGVVK